MVYQRESINHCPILQNIHPTLKKNWNLQTKNSLHGGADSSKMWNGLKQKEGATNKEKVEQQEEYNKTVRDLAVILPKKKWEVRLLICKILQYWNILNWKWKRYVSSWTVKLSSSSSLLVLSKLPSGLHLINWRLLFHLKSPESIAHMALGFMKQWKRFLKKDLQVMEDVIQKLQ